MMDAFYAALEARDPARGRFRAYRIEAGTDLLGDWLVDVTYGRIGTPGRTVRQAVPDEAAARKLVHQHLRRRATAPRRIGVGYQIRALNDPGQWAATPLP
jgi:predicted DNA-binding WGR domain protein